MTDDNGRSPFFQFIPKDINVLGHIKQAFCRHGKQTGFLFFAAGISITQLHGQTCKKLTLNQALDIAMKNNYSIRRSKIEMEVAGINIREKKQARLPDLETHGSYTRITDLTEYRHGLGDKKVTQTIPEIADLTGSFKMPVYAGGKLQYGIRLAEQEDKIAALELQKTMDDVHIDVVNVFLEICRTMEEEKIIRENIKEEEDRLREVKAFKAHGTVTKNEVLRAELQLLDMQEILATNQRRTVIGLHDLQTLLQLSEGELTAIDTAGVLGSVPSADEYQQYLNASHAHEDIQIALQQEGISRTAQKLVKANQSPVISLFGSYGLNYPNYMFFPPDPYAYTLGRVGVEATFNLSALYKNKAKMQIARKQVLAQEMRTKTVEDKISDNVFRRYMEYLDVLERISLSEKAVTQAAENYRIVKAKYLNQLVLITEMTDADTALLQARFKAISNRIDVVLRYYELLYAAGLLRQTH